MKSADDQINAFSVPQPEQELSWLILKQKYTMDIGDANENT